MFFKAHPCYRMLHLVLWLSNIPLERHTTFCLSMLMDIWLVSAFWLFWIMLLWTSMYKFCMDVCLHFSWVMYIPTYLPTYLGVELLDRMVTPCLTFWGTSSLFSTATAPFYNLPAVNQGINFSTSSPELVIVCLFKL